jgi:hypothetical protein
MLTAAAAAARLPQAVLQQGLDRPLGSAKAIACAVSCKQE